MTEAPTANLSRMLDWGRYRFADHDALVFEDRRWTYRQLDHDVNALAAGLLAEGLSPGDRVAVLAMNLPEYLLLGLSLAKIGAVMVPLNYRLHDSELRYLLGHADVVGLASEPAYQEVASALVSALPRVRHAIALEPMGDGWSSVADLVSEHAGERVPDAETRDSDLQRVLYTSGTTSRPKGARLTHGNVNANMNAQVVELGLTSDDRILNFAPLYHVGGLDIPGYATWYVGATMVLMRRFDASSVLEMIQRERITGMVMVATMLHLIRREKSNVAWDTSSVRWMIFSQVTQTLFAETRKTFPTAALIEGYGMTETCNGLTYLDMAHMESKQGSAGRPVPGVDLRIVDTDDRVLGVDEVGEIVVRGAKVCDGYLDDPVATAAAFRGGWFHTGDVGRIDQDGYLYILDRLKDMIRSGGENIASSSIEAVVYEAPGVLEAAVIGVPHATWVEVPAVFVVVEPEFDPADLISHCQTRLGRFKMPKAVYVVDELPRNPSGKILKRDLRGQTGSVRPAWVDPRDVEAMAGEPHG